MDRRCLAVLPVAMLAAACGGNDGVRHLDGGGGGDAHGTSSPGIYVTNANSTITVFALDASGDVAPLRTIAGATTGLSLPIGIVVDSSDHLYVANRTGSSVTVYPSTANGDVAPTRTLTATGMGSPEGVAIGLDDEVYVSTCPGCGASAGGDVGIYHFPAGATTADTSVTGATTGLTVPGSIGVDHQREVVIGNSFGGSVSTYAVGAAGDVAPLRSFTPASNSNLQSIAVGLASIAITNPSAGIELYDPAATGTTSPVTTLAPSTQLPISYPGGIAVDHTVTPPQIILNDFGANAIYVIETAGTEPNLTVASVRTISGATTMLNQPLGVAIVR